MSRARIAAALSAGAGVLLYASTADLYAGPLGNYVKSLDPEISHNLAIRFAKWNLPPSLPFSRPSDPPSLSTHVWGLHFSNPIGLAAGFDKHAEAIPGLFRLGFGFIEVGSVTPLPQPGNPSPRVFRLSEDAAIINRYGFNSHGSAVVADRLFRYDSGGAAQHRMGVLGVNLGKNRDTSEADAVKDYLTGLRTLGELAEYIVINISSPNTPGLRNLQGKEKLRELLRPVLEARDALVYRPPILVKIAPDLSREELRDVCDVAVELSVDGLVVSNTTVERGGLKSELRREAGGVSGRPLRDVSTRVVGDVFEMTGGKIPIVGVGGVESGQDAYEKIRAGASLVQLYTSLAYGGPRVVPRIKRELAELLARDGLECVSDAVGADHSKDTINE